MTKSAQHILESGDELPESDKREIDDLIAQADELFREPDQQETRGK